MGWTSSDNTRQQVLLKFDTKEEAIAYAQREGYAYVVEEPKAKRLQTRAYADNFKYDRVGRGPIERPHCADPVAQRIEQLPSKQ